MDILLELHYLPCVQYMSKFLLHDRLVVDDLERFEKQSYRNRCHLAGANGLLMLNIPVHDSRARLPVKEMRTDEHGNWRREHWQAILSAYGRSPFWEYYSDALEVHYTQAPESLLSFNLGLLKELMKLMGIAGEKLALRSDIELEEGTYIGLRNQIHSKERFRMEDPHFQPQPYLQVFSERHGFLPNLSALDLLFNEGPASMQVLEASAIR